MIKSAHHSLSYETFVTTKGSQSIQQQGKGKFNVYRRNEYSCKLQPYNRRDFYKISLILGEGNLHYADRGVFINAPALLLSNPNIPYSWEPTSSPQEGFFCVFTEDFVSASIRTRSLNESPLFKIGGDPLFFLPRVNQESISDIFEKMLKEIETDYAHKHDLMRNYVDLILHEAMKLQPAHRQFRPSNASSRITALFVELLERQFPIDSKEHALKFKTAHDFADQLSVHVNHLNRVVKETTGRTTTEHIAERIVQEAYALLQHTNLNISEIAYCLGFDYPAHFNNFFKKQTGKTPGELRVV
jgi:AraC family transcriptional regulator, transcriptional activator of pobA